MQAPRIYAIADARRWSPRPLPEVVADLAHAGWPWIQVRDKRACDRDLLAASRACVAAATGDTRVWINDRADIAAASGAWGVHLGEEDVPPAQVRSAFPGLRIGRTTRDAGGVEAADADPGVDFISFGPIFPTRTKADAPGPRGIAGFEAVRDLTDKPMIAIGGIEEHAIPDLRWAGANTVAVTGAVASPPSLVSDWVSRYAAPDNRPWPRIFITGFMTAGKNCVGRRLAAVLGWEFMDLDAIVEQDCNSTIPAIFESEGEQRFRCHETRALRRVTEMTRCVVACGGGVVEPEENRRILASDPGLVVWLDVARSELARRIAASPGARPLLGIGWEARLERRRPWYQRSADRIVEVGKGESIRRTVRRVFDRLEADR